MIQWKKGIASWSVGKTLYLSVPFTWLLPEAENMARQHKGKVIAGGPAVKLLGAPWADETPDSVPYDTLSFHNPLATFTTRGCPNYCPFCAVPRIEGKFRELDTWKPAPIVCDNNLLAASPEHFRRVIESVSCFPYVDFNQGLDARLFDVEHARLISSLHHAKVRFSFDHRASENTVHAAIDLARFFKLKDLGVYVLIGYNDTPEDALYRLEKVRSWGIFPNPMRYQPLDALVKNSYVAPYWTEKELKDVIRYFSRLAFVNGIPFENYDYHKRDERQETLWQQ